MSEIEVEEIWKEIENYNGDYSVSNFGRIKSFKRYKDGKIMKGRIDKDGYFKIVLYKNKKQKQFFIHRLVAIRFIPNQNDGKYIQVNHIDENKQNNHVKNLEWCLPQYNTEYSQAKKYKILFPDGHEEIIFNLRKFCRENNLQQGNMINTIINRYFHKGFKITEKTDKFGNIKKVKQNGNSN